LLYTSSHRDFTRRKDFKLLAKKENFQRNETWMLDTQVTLPLSTLQNGSLYLHAFLGPHGRDIIHPSLRDATTIISTPLTRYRIPSDTEFNLITGEYESITDDSSSQPTTHWIPQMDFYGTSEDWLFDSRLLPPELWITNILRRVSNTNIYVPILFCNDLHILNRHLQRVTPNNGTMPLSLSYSPIGLTRLRIWVHFNITLNVLPSLGFSDKDTDAVKEIIFGNSLQLLALTFTISFFHIMFDCLAFKNDISFWKGRQNVVGISKRTILWRCFSYTVVFLYLIEEETSLLVTIPSGIATVIEYWKGWKMLKLKIKWTSTFPKITLKDQLKQEQVTDEYDSQCMRYIGVVLIPLVIAGSIYCLLYLRYKSWYSWIVHSLVNGVYAFGFLFMFPQLFVNYKLKSVAHLPLRAFMYKAFNTFIDDVFAFIITMPTSHRVAVFRDDLVFLIYLYQRW
jgi:phosphate starvation-inducible membrane PsiE